MSAQTETQDDTHNSVRRKAFNLSDWALEHRSLVWYFMIVSAIAGVRDIAPATLAAERWVVGPQEIDPTTTSGLFFARTGLSPRDIAPYTSHAAAVAAAAAGEGIMLALAHAVIDAMRRRSLVRLDVRGTPIDEMWHASTLGLGRALPAALALQRFATTPDATQAMSTGRAGTASTRSRPAVHVTLWRSVAEELGR